MERTLCIPLGIIVERSRFASLWNRNSWRASGVLIGPSRLQAGSPLWRDEDVGYYFAGAGVLSLYPVDVPCYRANLQQPVPRLYVVLAAQEYDSTPPGVHLLTAAPPEAESHAVKGGPMQVDGLPMPKQLLQLVTAYIKEHAPPDVRPRGDAAPPLDRTEGKR